MPFLVRGFDRLSVRHGTPNQPIDLLHCLDLGFNDTQSTNLATPGGYLQRHYYFMTQ